MGDYNDDIISTEIKRIARVHPVVVLSGKVDSIGDGNMINVIITGDDDAVEVLNNVVTGNVKGIYGVPSIGADCEVAELDGPGKWTMIRASAYDDVYVKAGTRIHLNGDSLGGLTKTLELKTQIEKLNNKVEHLCSIINGSPVTEPGSGAPSALQAALKIAIAADTTANFNNIENQNIKQG